jgi:hypothetical protein
MINMYVFIKKGCCKATKGLTALTPEIDYDQTAMGRWW